MIVTDIARNRAQRRSDDGNQNEIYTNNKYIDSHTSYSFSGVF